MRNKEESSLEVVLKTFDGVFNLRPIKMSNEDTNLGNPLI